MKKSFIIAFGILLMFAQSVCAKTISVQALNDFSTENPPSIMSIKVMDDLFLDENLSFQAGYIVNGKIVDVSEPKRLKRDAVFSFVPLEYIDLNNKKHEITGYFPAKYTTKLNKGDIAKSAALGVGNYFVKGLSMGYSAIEGAVKNEQDNRLKSSANAVYEDSPFSYVEKGQQLYIKKDQLFLLNFKVKEEQADEPNYEYKLLDPSEIPINTIKKID